MVVITASYRQVGNGQIALKGLELDNQGEQMLKIKKIRKDTNCHLCKKALPKGSWCYGERYNKICVVCQKDKVFDRMWEDIRRILDKVNRGKEDLELNWEKYQRENTLANLAYNE